MESVGAAYLVFGLLTMAFGSAMFLYTLRQRTLPGGTPLMLILATMVGWTGTFLAEILVATFDGKLLFYNLRQIGVLLLPVFWLMMTYEIYTQARWRHWKALTALLIFPAITLAVSVTNQPVVRGAVGTVDAFGVTIISTARGPWVALEAIYSYALVAAGGVLLMEVARRTPPYQRRPVYAILTGMALLLVANLSDLLGVNPIRPLGPMTAMFVPTSLCFMWGLFRHRLLDVVPVARDRVLEAMTDGVMVVNSAGQIVDLNRAAREILARTLPQAGALVGMPAAERLAGWPGWVENMFERKQCFELTHGEGEGQRTYEVEITPLQAPSGAALGQIVLMKDITAKKQAMALMAEAARVRVLQRFIHDASHDLRTPMSVIQSSSYLIKRLTDKQIEALATLHPKLPQAYAAVIEEVIDRTGKVRDRAVSAEEAGRRLWNILAGMIEMAEMETAPLLERSTFDLNALVEDVVLSRRGEAERRGVTVETTLDPGIGPVYADEKRFGRAVDALVLNAVQYTPAGGRVDIATRCCGTSSQVLIRDSGMGISAEDLPHIFERFFRADRARNTENGGAGLGLSLAKMVVEAHGGHIEAKSEAGVGSEFRIALPPHQPSDTPRPAGGR